MVEDGKLICVGKLPHHQWGEWIGYDKHVYFMTQPFRYWRECMVLGCGAIEKVEALMPSGRREVVPPG